MTQTVLITGSSSGIGLEMARIFAREGNSLVLVARGKENLEKLAAELRDKYKSKVEVVDADLTDPTAPRRVANTLKERQIVVDVLVNNAGFGLLGAIANLDMQRQLDMVQVNVAALVNLTRIFLPGMIERNRGGVLNVASTAAFQAGPNMALYYASKSFVLSFTEALHEEVAGTNLHVSCLCPGPTHTGFLKAAEMEGAALFRLGAQSAAEVAQYGYDCLQRNKAIAVSGWKNRVLATSTMFTPRFITRKIAKMLNVV